jgi:hypothetical protein
MFTMPESGGNVRGALTGGLDAKDGCSNRVTGGMRVAVTLRVDLTPTATGDAEASPAEGSDCEVERGKTRQTREMIAARFTKLDNAQ